MSGTFRMYAQHPTITHPSPHFGGACGRTLFVDLDGVLADFDGGFLKLFGFDNRAVEDDLMWSNINAYGTFFQDLPAFAGAVGFYKSIAGLNPIILTACPAE